MGNRYFKKRSDTSFRETIRKMVEEDALSIAETSFWHSFGRAVQE